MSGSEGKRSGGDVRMRGFTSRSTVEAALAWVDAQAQPLAAEVVDLHDAAGRVLAADVRAEVNVPGFTRSMMDGYALRAADTQGASSYNPLALSIVGQSLPGHPYAGQVEAGQAVRIMTGAPLPDGADAVLPVEQTEVQNTQLLAQGDVSPEKNVGRPGEDVPQGSTVLSAARRLRPQDIGVLSSIGCGKVTVRRQPRVRLVITGNELLPAGTRPDGYQIVDANSPMLSALVRRDSGLPEMPGIIPDEEEAIAAALASNVDVVLVSGGSSVGQEDFVPKLLADRGELAIHGIAMRPSSPAGMGRLENRLVFLLPGNPVSCLCAYDFFAGRAIRQLGGLSPDWPYATRRSALLRKLSSVVGRVDYARVQLREEGIEPLAISGASVLSSTTRADGFVVIPADSEGFPAGAEVVVYLYD